VRFSFIFFGKRYKKQRPLNTIPAEKMNSLSFVSCRWFRTKYLILLTINMATLSRGGKPRVDPHWQKLHKGRQFKNPSLFFFCLLHIKFHFFFFLLFIRRCNINQPLLNTSNMRNGVSSDIQPPRSNMEVICHTREQVFWHLTSIFLFSFLFSFFFFTPTSRGLNII